ncbi:MAG TPA: NADH-quinone oxidoreductase subunit NuoE [Firmicutes bacterium]|uniref:NADH-quinone oxidoreductase subunit NuoE n=1 Tax=candidate division TA06 bacterium TaxID=2250710 RepID=A0A660SBH0_UNCT6|nr:NADH-quinone oxidoreductase subunit NuoE [candidate division WOR-3 bacterium]RKX68148.1 MAG: NADH-quinone oxidoreductase subunit NuoE [candidate division TA06 bacterium]HFD04980.1 NADH-quinone oxidoreductase subunit NuoE [Bacillota bacterium]
MDTKNALSVEEIIQKHSNEKGTLIPILQEIQESFGYISKDAIETISRLTNYAESDIYGVATFYSQFKLEEPGLHNIKICQGTACHVNGADTVKDVIFEELKLIDYGTTDDKKFTVEHVACLGCCSLAPVMMIDGVVYGKLTPDKIRKILKSF